MYIVSSYTCSIFKPNSGKTLSFKSFNVDLTPFITSITFAPLCLIALIAIESLPRNLIIALGSLNVNSTSAISFTFTLPNLPFKSCSLISTISFTCCSVFISPSALTIYSLFPSLTSPAEIELLASLIIFITLGTVSP